MAAEHFPITLAGCLNTEKQLAEPVGYYRSKLFIAPNSTNALVAAAGPILSLLERLCLSKSLPPIETIRDNIEHELKAFLSKLHAKAYSIEVISLGRYVLCATIDELLGKNYLRVYGSAPEFKSFTPLTNDNSQPQSLFFEILGYVRERPNQHLDLIELIYFCLIAGFEGEYHLKADGRQSLDNYVESLYQCILQHRYNKSQRMFNEHIIPKKIKKDHKTTMITVMIALGLVAVAYITSHVLLEMKAKSVLFGHSQLALLDY
jgi:type VI secretion system protein ImpK